jgi:hypothetical protein
MLVSYLYRDMYRNIFSIPIQKRYHSSHMATPVLKNMDTTYRKLKSKSYFVVSKQTMAQNEPRQNYFGNQPLFVAFVIRALRTVL